MTSTDTHNATSSPASADGRLALRLAGWDDDRPVWTGILPLPALSAAPVSGEAIDDERHLWPAGTGSSRECRPAVVFGEQVASKDGREWLAGVRADLEALGYAVGARRSVAAGVGAPHIRQRLWFVADAGCAGDERRVRSGEAFGTIGPTKREAQKPEWSGADSRRCGCDGELADSRGPSLKTAAASGNGKSSFEIRKANQPGNGGAIGGLGQPASKQMGDTRFPWRQSDTVDCADGKVRRIEPGTFPLAHGIPARVGRLRAYGNAIVPQVAAEFIGAFLDINQAHQQVAFSPDGMPPV